MAETAGEQRLLSMHGLGRSAELLVQVATAQGFTVAAVGQNRFRMALSFRPKWATITAIALAPFAGLGLFLLMVRRTTSLDSVVEEHHKGVEVRIVGAGGAALAAELERAFAGEGDSRRPVNVSTASFAPSTPVQRAQPSPPPALRAQPTPPPPAQRTQPPSPPRPASYLPVNPQGDGAWRVAPPSPYAGEMNATVARSGPTPPANPAPPGVALVLPDGRRLTLDRVVVIGRDPVDDGSAGASTTCAIHDPSLSKTHAAFGPSGAGAWVVDRHSTNGTTVTAGSGTRPCPPGIRVEVSVGASVLLGDLAVAVVAS